MSARLCYLSLLQFVCAVLLCAVHTPTQNNLFLPPMPPRLSHSDHSDTTRLETILKHFQFHCFRTRRRLVVLLGIILVVGSHTKARPNQREYVLPRKKVEEEHGVDGDKGVGREVLNRMVLRETVERRAARGGSDVPDVGHGHQLRNLRRGNDRAEEFRKPESVVCVHEKVDKAVHEHAAAFCAGIVHDIQEQEKRGGMVIQVQKADFRKRFAAQKVVCRVQPLPYLG
jgi:hypothetical protein